MDVMERRVCSHGWEWDQWVCHHQWEVAGHHVTTAIMVIMVIMDAMERRVCSLGWEWDQWVCHHVTTAIMDAMIRRECVIHHLVQ